MADIDSLIRAAADKERVEIVQAIDVLVKRLEVKDATMTRTVIREALVGIKGVVESSIKRFAELANARMDEREVETEKKDVLAAETKRNEAQKQLEETTRYYRTALEILDRDADVTEKDVEWAADQADPLAALVQQRTKRKSV